jgi:3-oxoadipate enol-lactonase
MSFINLNGGLIHYKYLPHKDGGKTFLFINSLGTDFRIWNDVADILKEHGNILMYDKRGHGLSDVVTDTKGLNDFAEDAVALLKYLKIDQCIIIGVSVGGMIAQIIAGRFPQLVEKLVLCDTRHKIGNEQGWNDRIGQVREHGIQFISEGVMQKWFFENFRNSNTDRVKGYKNMLERSPALGYIQTCEAIRDANLQPIAEKIKIATLCIVGSEDGSTPPGDVKELADIIEGSVYIVLQGSGHIPGIDNPQALTKLIIDFCKD